MSISDSGWWIANQFAEAPTEIRWPESWVRTVEHAMDFSKAFRDALRLLVSFNTDAHKRKHWLCERCHDSESCRVWHVQPKFGEFAAVIAEWLGPEEVRRLAAMSQASWPIDLRQCILDAHREECTLMALCGSCVSQGNPRPETTTKDS
jgi:hypothetical protein